MQHCNGLIQDHRKTQEQGKEQGAAVIYPVRLTAITFGDGQQLDKGQENLLIKKHTVDKLLGSAVNETVTKLDPVTPQKFDDSRSVEENLSMALTTVDKCLHPMTGDMDAAGDDCDCYTCMSPGANGALTMSHDECLHIDDDVQQCATQEMERSDLLDGEHVTSVSHRDDVPQGEWEDTDRSRWLRRRTRLCGIHASCGSEEACYYEA